MERRRSSRWLRAAFLSPTVLLVAILGVVNVRAYRPGGPEMAVAQVRYLERELAEGGAERMQNLFPEGYVFTWALYGLAAAQIAEDLPETDPRRSEMGGAARDAVRHVQSERARRTFVRDMTPGYGAFYTSWSLYLRSVVLRALHTDDAPPFDIGEFERDCARFAAALQASETPFLPSYPDLRWPADTGVGVAALAIRDQVLEPRYEALTSGWIADLREEVDPTLGAVPQAAGLVDGWPNDGPRGESLALLGLILADVDADFAREQYEVLREHFVDYRWGVPGVLEYPRGVEGPSDVDSGPLVLGFSGPAIVVGAGAATVHGDEEVAHALLAVAEVFGVPVEVAGRRRYALGLVPVGDAFLAWVRTVGPTPSSPDVSWEPVFPRWWRLPLHAVSLLIGALATWRAVRVWRGGAAG